MTYPSTQMLADLRAVQADFLPDTCTLRAVTRSSDGQGGWTDAWADTYTGVPCRLAVMPIQGGESAAGSQVTSLSAWVLHIPWDQAVDPEWRVVHEGITYEIVQLEASHTNRTATQVHLRRRE